MYRISRSIPLLIGLVLAAAPACAQGISLRWGECVADGGVRNLAFACNTNTGVTTLVTSFVLAAPLSQVSGAVATIDVIAADLTLPAWWNFRDCRSGSEFMNPAALGPVSCANPWPPGSCIQGGVNSVAPGTPSANAERIVFTRLACSPRPDLAPGVEIVGPPLSINHNRTVGSPSCTGCITGVCILLNQVVVASPAATVTLTQPMIPADGNVITWQGAGPGPGGACLAATPTRRRLWGEVKALYR